MEPAVIVLRLAQFGGAGVLFGVGLAGLYAPPMQSALQPSSALICWSAATTVAATVLGLIAQTAVLAGSLADALTPEAMVAVMTTMALGPAAAVRAAAALLALGAAFTLKRGRALDLAVAILGGVAVGSFAWMGHGAASPGAGRWIHLGADILHSLAAGAWIGALAAFLLRLASPHDRATYAALHGFGGVGALLVAILVATGLVNSWYLVGPDRLAGLINTPYGQLLSLKLALFFGMLGLAASNRYRLTPALGAALQSGAGAMAARTALARSLWFEAALGAGVLALVAWLGTLEPVSGS